MIRFHKRIALVEFAIRRRLKDKY